MGKTEEAVFTLGASYVCHSAQVNGRCVACTRYVKHCVSAEARPGSHWMQNDLCSCKVNGCCIPAQFNGCVQ